MALALAGGQVVTSLDPPTIVSADVTIDGDRVSSVGPASLDPPLRPCVGCLIVPGNVCAHTQLYSGLARGMPLRLEPPANFVQIIQRIWWRLDRALDEGAIRALALVGGAAALLTGTTSLVDHHASSNAIDGSLDLIADAPDELRVQSILSYEVTDRDGPERVTQPIQELSASE